MTHTIWWDMEGSGMRPLPNEDMEEFAKRISEIAWSNGQYKEREACAKVCEEEGKLWLQAGCTDTKTFKLCATVIRARGEA